MDGEPHVEQVLEALEARRLCRLGVGVGAGGGGGAGNRVPLAAPLGGDERPAQRVAQHEGEGGAPRAEERLQEGRHQHVLGALVEHHAARRPEPPPVGPQRGARARGEQRRQRRRVGEERAQRRVLRVEDGVAVRVHRLQQLALGAARRDHLLEVRVLHPRAGVHVDLPLPRRRLHVPRVERVEAQPRDAGHLAEQRRQRRRARPLQPADEEEFVRRAARVGADVRHVGARGRRRGRWWRWWRWWRRRRWWSRRRRQQARAPASAARRARRARRAAQLHQREPGGAARAKRRARRTRAAPARATWNCNASACAGEARPTAKSACGLTRAQQDRGGRGGFRHAWLGELEADASADRGPQLDIQRRLRSCSVV